jgi:hypothetical protein
MGRKPLRLMASVPCRWASPLNEGLGSTLVVRQPFVFSWMKGASQLAMAAAHTCELLCSDLGRCTKI